MLDRIIKLSSISGAFLVFCGVLKLIIYYNSFNVNIVDYLSFSEIITSFLDDVNILLVYASIMLVITFSTMNFIHRSTNVSHDELFTGIMNAIYPHRYKFVLFFLGMILLFSILLLLEVFGLNYFIIYVLVYCAIQMLTFIVISRMPDGTIDIPNFSIIISVSLTITFALFLLAKHDIQQTTNNKYPSIIYTETETYTCSNKTKNIYIGKTDSFLFIKLDSINSTIAIPVSDIKKIEFK